MKKKPPFWYDPEAQYSALFRMPVNALWREDDMILAADYDITTDDSMLADAVMYEYLDRDRPQNLTGLGGMLKRHPTTIGRSMDRLEKLEAVFLKGGNYYPSPYLVKGSYSSQEMIRKFLAVAEEMLQLVQDKTDNTPEYQAKQVELDEKITRLHELMDSHK